MRNRKFHLPRLASFLFIFAILTSSCDLLDEIARALAAACARPEFLVTRTDDPPGGLCSATNCSLRQAVTLSNACAGTQTIRIPAGTYTLTLTGANEDSNLRGDLDITQDVNIVGVGYPAIDGNGTDRALDIKTGATVTLQTLVIQNGQAQWGGGITNAGHLTATDVLIQGNHDSIGGSAAGVFTSGVAVFSHSAFFNNISYEETAGIQNDGTLSLDNVTITGNHGYGVMNDPTGTTEIIFSTIADNPGPYELWNNGPVSSFTIDSSIIAGHVADGNCFAPIQSNGFNIDTSVATSGNICGLGQPSDLNGIDPLLDPAAIFGGTLPIRPFRYESPARDSADPGKCGGTDQRGVTRPQGPACDRGAYEKEWSPQNQSPTFTPTALPTFIPSIVPSPIYTSVPSATPAAASASLVLNKNANCRKGPGINYDVITSFVQGTSLNATGRDQEGTWWNAQIPSGGYCWIANSTVDKMGSFDALPILPAPPVPDSPSGFNDSSLCSPKEFKVTLTWVDVSNEKGYRLYRNGKLIAEVGPNITKYVDSPPKGQDFEYQLAAFNENGESDRLGVIVGACK
ncbi:MAG TPA: SH3 domain-containing protein [Anaerolineales bacterium]|nr:SH3 domain-containing protein [Anaerolineales bacterium]